MTGDQNDMLARLKAVLPPWFGNLATPVLDAVLSGFASVAASVYTLLAFTKAQTRIRAASDGFLDLIALDFFGRRVQRFTGETDSAFQARILREILRPRATLAALRQMLVDLTGRVPVILEPARPANAGGYGIGAGYAVAGAYASLSYPAQVFVVAYRPANGGGIPNVDGYGGSLGGYGAGAIEYGALPQISGVATDAAIYAAIDSVTPTGVTSWVQIQS
jgi:hypothetical protein